MNLLRAEGWEDVVASFVITLVSVFFWYRHSLYLYPAVVVAGIGAGVVVYLITIFEEDHLVAAFPVTMVLILVMLIALHETTLVAGVVAATSTATAIKIYEVYL